MNLWSTIVERVGAHIKGPWLVHVLNLYPPYLGAGIRVREIGLRGFAVSMPLRFWNRNYHGTHFGGSLYSMCDPFFALVLLRNLGRGYVVWDKSASIRFRRPGEGTVTARFEISAQRIRQLREEVDVAGVAEAEFHVRVMDARGEVVAEVSQIVHLRASDAERPVSIGRRRSEPARRRSRSSRSSGR